MKTRRPTLMIAGTSAAVVAAAAVALVLARPAPSPVARATVTPSQLSTAAVRRTDLVNSQLIAGTIGYHALAPLANQLSGIYTSLPSPGALIDPGATLYRVDDMPAVLMLGATPAWRALAPGVIPGPDITELNQNLAAMGYLEPGYMPVPPDSYGVATEIAVERWQHALGVPITGTVVFGAVIFRPSALRIGALLAATGSAASAGAPPYTVTSSRRAVVAALSAGDASEARVGAAVHIQLSDGRTVSGTIASIAPSITGSQSAPTLELTVSPSAAVHLGSVDQAPVEVALTTAVARHVLAVPVTALLALAGGGYGVQVVPRTGSTRLVAIRAGMFSTGLVEVHGGGLEPGTRVVISQ